MVIIFLLRSRSVIFLLSILGHRRAADHDYLTHLPTLLLTFLPGAVGMCDGVPLSAADALSAAGAFLAARTPTDHLQDRGCPLPSHLFAIILLRSLRSLRP